jgi:hypothetical protein
VPDATPYTMRIRYWAQLGTVTSSSALIWPDAWDELLRWETLYRYYYSIEAFEKADSLMRTQAYPRQPGAQRHAPVFEIGIIPRLWNDLLSTMSAHEGTDEDFNINPVIRAYTVR